MPDFILRAHTDVACQPGCPYCTLFPHSIACNQAKTIQNHAGIAAAKAEVLKELQQRHTATSLLTGYRCLSTVQGLMPLYLNPKSGRFTTTKVSLGALGDSYYEYLLKMWIMKGRSPADEMYRIMWERAMDEMIEKLVFTSSPENLTYVAEFDRCGAFMPDLCPATC